MILPDVSLITKENYPKLFECLETVFNDMGAQAGHSNYSIPMQSKETLTSFNGALAMLSKEEFEIFCIGEEGDVLKICRMSLTLTKLDEFIKENL